MRTPDELLYALQARIKQVVDTIAVSEKLVHKGHQLVLDSETLIRRHRDMLPKRDTRDSPTDAK